MADNLKPRDAAEVEQAVNWAMAGGKTLEIVGHGSQARDRPGGAMGHARSTFPGCLA